jgi:hypothetical protein
MTNRYPIAINTNKGTGIDAHYTVVFTLTEDFGVCELESKNITVTTEEMIESLDIAIKLLKGKVNAN